MIKTIAGTLASRSLPQCRFDRTIFVFGHMRCGSTALSNILCSHPEISGYGEAHVTYDSRAALGILALNQWRRGAFRMGARRLFDKVLHNRYDAAPSAGFYDAKAIFLVRSPDESIRSIRKLFATLGSGEYDSDEATALYLNQRLSRLATIWQSFPETSRIGLSYDQLTADPDAALLAISRCLDLRQPLENRYKAATKPMLRGAGDPLSSHKFNMIVPSSESTTLDRSNQALSLAPSLHNEVNDRYLQFIESVRPSI